MASESAPLNDRVSRIEAPGVRSLSWVGDSLVDWAGGGCVMHLDGRVERGYINFGYRFDASVASPCGNYSVIYEKRGTKGLVLHGAKILREVNRSYYCADAYEYPVAIFQPAGSNPLLAHCPNEYCRLELEDLATGESVGDAKSRKKSPDFFHSRLRVSADGRWLLSAGWVWHPFGMVDVFDLDVALKRSEALDESIALPEIEGEVAAAEFLGSGRILLATSSEEPLGNDVEDAIGPNTVAVVDLATRQVVSRAPVEDPLGSLMPIDENVAIGFFEHPKMVSLQTGKIVKRWGAIKSGNQDSSIIWNGVSTPPIAIDVDRRRFAVADESGVTVLELL